MIASIDEAPSHILSTHHSNEISEQHLFAPIVVALPQPVRDRGQIHRVRHDGKVVRDLHKAQDDINVDVDKDTGRIYTHIYVHLLVHTCALSTCSLNGHAQSSALSRSTTGFSTP